VIIKWRRTELLRWGLDRQHLAEAPISLTKQSPVCGGCNHLDTSVRLQIQAWTGQLPWMALMNDISIPDTSTLCSTPFLISASLDAGSAGEKHLTLCFEEHMLRPSLARLLPVQVPFHKWQKSKNLLWDVDESGLHHSELFTLGVGIPETLLYALISFHSY
jgi:hypothetical protein